MNEMIKVDYDVVFDNDDCYKMTADELNSYMKENDMIVDGVTVIGHGPISVSHFVTVEATRENMKKFLIEKLELDDDEAEMAIDDGEVTW